MFDLTTSMASYVLLPIRWFYKGTFRIIHGPALKFIVIFNLAVSLLVPLWILHTKTVRAVTRVYALVLISIIFTVLKSLRFIIFSSYHILSKFKIKFHSKALSLQSKSSYEKRIMKSVKLQKDPNYGFGMVITCGNTYDTISQGAFIESVQPGSPAYKNSNICPGDQILSVNGTDVQNDNFLTVVNLLQYASSPVEIVVAKSNLVSDTQDSLKEEVIEEPFTNSKTWLVGDEEDTLCVKKSEDKNLKMPIPQPRKKWLEQEKQITFDIPDLTINHTSNSINDHSWTKKNLSNNINGQPQTRDNIPDIIASQIKYESGNLVLVQPEMNIKESFDSNTTQDENENILLPGEIFHVVMDKKGGSLGLNIYQGTESAGSEQRHIYIHSIIPNGAADLDGRIKPGDKLLEVNEVLLENLSYQEVVTKLRESPQVAHLVLEKGGLIEPGQSSCDPKLTCSTNFKNEQSSSFQESVDVADKCKEFTSKDKNKQMTQSFDASYSSMPEKDCDPAALSYSSLPSTIELDSNNSCAKDMNFSPLRNTKNIEMFKTPQSFQKRFNGKSNGYNSISSPNYAKVCKKNMFNNKLNNTLASYSSTPNLADNSDEDDDEYQNCSLKVLYRNKSTECLSPHFSNPHPALCDIYNNFSFVRGSSNKMHSIPAVPIRRKKLKKLQDIYDYSNPDNTFKVSIRKSSRGLGLSICGGTGVAGRDMFSQLIRIRQLYPLQPALECGKLQLGDVILSVNGINMVGLTNTEALEVLRTTPTDVDLEVFRPTKSFIPSYSTFKNEGVWPFYDSSSSSASSSLSRSENVYNVETGEFEVILMKRGGSLGFSICRKESLPENLEEGIFVKALVREPAISDGRIQPGDKILQVNGIDISAMSHAEAIEFIRKTPNSVTLKLLRSDPPLSPAYFEKDNPITKPLRWEAMELLNGRVKDRESGDESSVSKRKVKRKLDRASNVTNSSSTDSNSTTSSSSSGQEHIIEEQPVADSEHDLDVEGTGLQRNQRPKSLDALNSSDRKRLPQYMAEESFHRQSSVMCTNVENKSKNETDTTDGQTKKAGKNLLKWRGSTLPHSDEDTSPDITNHAKFSISSTSNEQSPTSLDSCSDDEKPVPFPRTTSRLTEWVHTFDVDLDRGWHGRLGFSLCDPPPTETDSPRSLLPIAAEVKAVHPGSLADKDGRIKVGDRIVEVST